MQAGLKPERKATAIRRWEMFEDDLRYKEIREYGYMSIGYLDIGYMEIRIQILSNKRLTPEVTPAWERGYDRSGPACCWPTASFSNIFSYNA